MERKGELVVVGAYGSVEVSADAGKPAELEKNQTYHYHPNVIEDLEERKADFSNKEKHDY